MRKFSLPQSHQKRVVIGDVHNDIENLWKLLQKVEAIDASGERNPDVWLACVGDLIHGGHNSYHEDGMTLYDTQDLFDCLLIGNHEFPFLYPHRNNGFAGMHRQLEGSAMSLLLETQKQDLWQPCVEVDGWLISHAGLDPRFLQQMDIPTAEKVNYYISQKWREYIVHKTNSNLFEQVGHHRGGISPFGGIFWNDLEELIEGYKYHNIPLKQLVGHTPQDNPRYASQGKIACVDVGAKLSGDLALAYKQPDEKKWHLLSIKNDCQS